MVDKITSLFLVFALMNSFNRKPNNDESARIAGYLTASPLARTSVARPKSIHTSLHWSPPCWMVDSGHTLGSL